METEILVCIGEKLDTPHIIRIIWGSKSHQRRRKGAEPVCEYRFATKEELEAFSVGVDAAEGYLGYSLCIQCKCGKWFVPDGCVDDTVCDDCYEAIL